MKKVFVLAAWLLLFSLGGCKKDDDPGTPDISVFHPKSGAAGTEVTISGINFGNNANESTVAFNGVTATVLGYSETLIRAVVPEGATTGPVSLTRNGTTTASDDHFMVLTPVSDDPSFYFGADLSYVNQILDKGGEYKVDGITKDPYEIFSAHGTDVVRLRLWHNPVWTKEVYEPDGDRMYNDLLDVASAIGRSKAAGMKVLLDFHYSDFWADPGSQEIPAAWLNIRNINDLKDSVYNYTHQVLAYLNGRGLMPEMVQIGNEINCGMLYEHNGTPVSGFPSCNSCEGQTMNLKTVLNSGIKAVRDVAAQSATQTKILLHVADPKNVEWWFDNVTGGTSSVTDFDMIGISYYPLWHQDISLTGLSDVIAGAKSRFGKQVMVLETAYPWTTSGNDNYNNLFGGQSPVNGYPYTQQGQLDMMIAITQEVIDGGGAGVIYWEPAWITSPLRDFWNTGSSWENCTFFDFDGNVIRGISYTDHPYVR